MKFGQLLQYNRIFFVKNYGENEVGRLVPDIFLFFEKALYDCMGWKSVVKNLVSIYIGNPRLGLIIKENYKKFQTFDAEIR